MKCYLCGGDLSLQYKKYSPVTRKEYTIFACEKCGLWQLNPPPRGDLANIYEENYFHQRTERGYADYESQKVKSSIENTLGKNLRDLQFETWEKDLLVKEEKPRALDIGCAAGYFVSHLKERGWASRGIEISSVMAAAARKNHLDVIHGDFLKTPMQTESLDLVTMWATIEHLEDPMAFLEKIHAILKTGGHLILSTCHQGFFAKIRKEKWRYLNVPEHIYYFKKSHLRFMAKKAGFVLSRSFTYGSGFTAKDSAPWYYKFIKYLCDRCARHFHSGDMIVMDYIKN